MINMRHRFARYFQADAENYAEELSRRAAHSGAKLIGACEGGTHEFTGVINSTLINPAVTPKSYQLLGPEGPSLLL